MLYPTTYATRGEQRDQYLSNDGQNITVFDPYRWLENPESAETKQWVQEENKITYDFLKKCELRDELKNRLMQAQNYKKIGIPVKHGEYYYFGYNSGL